MFGRPTATFLPSLLTPARSAAGCSVATGSTATIFAEPSIDTPPSMIPMVGIPASAFTAWVPDTTQQFIVVSHFITDGYTSTFSDIHGGMSKSMTEGSFSPFCLGRPRRQHALPTIPPLLLKRFASQLPRCCSWLLRNCRCTKPEWGLEGWTFEHSTYLSESVYITYILT